MKQPDLFLPCLAAIYGQQGELFEHNSETNLRCEQCGAYLVETPSGYVTCPKGCGKLIDPEPCGSWFEEE